MRTFFFFILACFISSAAYWGALNANVLRGQVIAAVIGLLVWSLFAVWCRYRKRKADLRKSRERLFQHHMRMHYGKR